MDKPLSVDVAELFATAYGDPKSTVELEQIIVLIAHSIERAGVLPGEVRIARVSQLSLYMQRALALHLLYTLQECSPKRSAR